MDGLPSGPLHTQADNGDHEIVGAQKECSKAVPSHY